LVGNTEPATEVVVTRGVDKYVSTADGNGDFKVTGILLEEGPNVFTLTISDEAGNELEVEEKIKVIYSMDSNVNGNAVADEIPIASGELSKAMQTIFGNNLMMVFGLLAILVFMLSTGFVVIKYKQER
jgi:hypothetical protein